MTVVWVLIRFYHKVVAVLSLALQADTASSRSQYTKHSLPGRAAIFLPRMRSGRNSKVPNLNLGS